MAWYEDDDLWNALSARLRTPEALAEAEREVDQLLALAGVVPGTRVLDLGCGAGRHAIALARRGYRVTAVDRSPGFLAQLSAAARRAGVEVEVVRRDVRDFRRPGAYDAVLCLGLLDVLDDPDDELAAVSAMCACLVPGGCAVIAVPGSEVAARSLCPRDWDWVSPGVLLIQEHQASSDLGRLRTRVSIVEGGRVQKFDLTHRLHSGSELRALLGRSGFTAARMYGDLDGRPYDRHARRLVALAER